MKGLTVGVIGCGNMGSAIVEGMVSKNIAPASAILLNDKDIQRSAALAKKTGAVQEELRSLAARSQVLILAVKPQDAEGLLKQISGDIKRQTIISVMAGVRIKTIEKTGEGVPVARAMPNMAAFAQEGMTCVAFNGAVKDKETVKSIFQGVGQVMEVREKMLDAVTALSGSGPAYFFYLAEAMISAGEKMGLDKNVAIRLVEQTLYGAAALLRKEKAVPADLIRKVASKGGTTEAALSVFDDKGMKAIIEEAILNAEKRSRELSGD